MTTGHRSKLRRERVPRRYGCTLCGRRDAAETRGGAVLCGRCRKELAPTPLDQALFALDMTEAEFAALTGLPRLTVIRAAKGRPVRAATAKALARATGFDPAVFLRGAGDG